LEQDLRSFTYSTHVPVPPSDRDWVSFLLFESKTGYCDYFATAMTVMLRAVGIPARVASGYVTGDWDSATQSYLVGENHAHTWTEVYFPDYGWITFEPSANRQAPARLEKPATVLSPEEIEAIIGADRSDDDLLFDDEDDYPDATVLSLPQSGAQSGPSPLLVAGLIALAILALAALVVTVLWFYGIGQLPAFARPYARIVRLASWSGTGPGQAQTPYEFSRDLAQTVPAAARPLGYITEAYVAGTYGKKEFDATSLGDIRAAGKEALGTLFRLLAIGRWRSWASTRLRTLAGSERRH
jgi:hypothetical protein